MTPPRPEQLQGFPGSQEGAPPLPGPSEKRLRCARRPGSSADSASARTAAQNPPCPAQFKLRTPEAMS
eukprot:7088087-Alexandrium_andersonii.AAC.1